MRLVWLLQDEFVVALPNSGATESILGTDQFIFPYSKGTLDGVNAQSIKTALSEAAIPGGQNSLSFSGYLPCSNRFSFRLTDCRYRCISLFKITFYSLRLIDCLKIITYCATVPVILSAILNFVNPMFNDGILVILLSLFFSLSQPKRTTEYPWFLKSLEQKSLWILFQAQNLINGGNRTNSFGNKPKFSKIKSNFRKFLLISRS